MSGNDTDTARQLKADMRHEMANKGFPLKKGSSPMAPVPMTPEDTERRTVARREGDPDPGSNAIKFDKTINLGHVLTVASMIGAVMISWSLMDKRVVVLEEARQAQRDRDMTQDTGNKEKFQEVRDALIDLRRSVEKVSDKVGAK